MNIKVLSGNDIYRLVITAKGKDHWRIDYMTLGMKYDEFKQECIAIGEARGEKRGMQQKAYETARIALQNNIPLEMIQKLTSLSKEEILALNLHNH